MITRIIFVLILIVGCVGLEAQTRPPQPITQPAPEHPYSAKRRGIAGRVVITFVVTTEGKVADIKVIESADPDLSESVVATVKQWRFTPPMLNGRVVNARMKQGFEFTLKENASESPIGKKTGEPGATDNPGYAQRLREDH